MRIGQWTYAVWLQTCHWVETTQMGTKIQNVDVVKWIATIIKLIGYGMTGLSFTPYNVYLFLSGFFCGLLLGWCRKTGRLWWCMSVLLYRFWSAICPHDFSYKRSSSAARWWLYFAVAEAYKQGLFYPHWCQNKVIAWSYFGRVNCFCKARQHDAKMLRAQLVLKKMRKGWSKKITTDLWCLNLPRNY